MSSRLDREEVPAIGRQEEAGHARLAWHERHRRKRSHPRAVRVEVAGHPLGIDVELDRSHDACAEERIRELSRGEVLAARPHQMPVSRDPSAERAGSLTPPRVAPQHDTQSTFGATVPRLISSVRFWRTEATGVPGAGMPACHAPMSVCPRQRTAGTNAVGEEPRAACSSCGYDGGRGARWRRRVRWRTGEVQPRERAITSSSSGHVEWPADPEQQSTSASSSKDGRHIAA